MAKLEQGILGPFRGKVGTVVGYLWRGKHVVRAYRREINYPNTEHQQAEREWFVGMVRFAATARQALLLGLREKATQWQMTEGNAFVRMNKECFGRDAACRVRSAAAMDMPRAAERASCGSTADAARRVRTETPLRPAATSPCEGEERKNTISNQRYATSNQKYTSSDCSPLQGEERENTISKQKYTTSNQTHTPFDCSPLQGEERENTISNQRYATSNQKYTPSGCSPLQGELPEGVRGGVDYEHIRIAEGAAAPVRFSTANVDTNNVLRIDFEKNSGMSRAKGSDRVYVYVYNIDTREGLLSAAAERRRGHLEMQLPEGWNHQNVKLWGFVVDGEGRASASVYIPLDDNATDATPAENAVQHTGTEKSEQKTALPVVELSHLVCTFAVGNREREPDVNN